MKAVVVLIKVDLRVSLVELRSPTLSWGFNKSYSTRKLTHNSHNVLGFHGPRQNLLARFCWGLRRPSDTTKHAEKDFFF